MSFSKKVDNIINELKDINKLYFSLQTKNKNLSMKLKEKKCEGASETGASETGASETGAGNNLSRPIGYGTSGNIDTSDFPAAGISGSNRNSSHNQWTTSLRRWWM